MESIKGRVFSRGKVVYLTSSGDRVIQIKLAKKKKNTLLFASAEFFVLAKTPLVTLI